MQLVDHLMTIFLMEEISNQINYATGLYYTNRFFADYVDVAYKRSYISRYEERPVPEFKTDNVPIGFNYSTVEKQFKQFVKSAFSVAYEEDNTSIEQHDKMLIQVMESVSKPEQDFLVMVVKKEIPFLPYEIWKDLEK